MDAFQVGVNSIVSSADNFCNQFGSRSGLTKCRTWSRSNSFDTQMVFLKEFFEKVDFEIIRRRQKACKISQGGKQFPQHMFMQGTIPIHSNFDKLAKDLQLKVS